MNKVKIVIIDSGVYPHRVFGDNTPDSFSYNGSELVPDPDKFGHGTAIYNIVKKCTGFTEIVNIKIPGIESGADEDILNETLSFAARHLRPNIINLSMGITVCADIERLYETCQRLSDMGIILISAFDNAGAFSYPAAFDNVIGVTSGRFCSKVSNFEYIEDSVANIAANGNNQRVAWIDPEYIFAAGNSFACAHVTAKAAEFVACGAATREEILEKFKEISGRIYSFKHSGAKRNAAPQIRRAALFPFNKEMHSLVRFESLISFEITDIYDSKYSMNVGATTDRLLRDDKVKKHLVKNINSVEWDTFDTLILGHTDELAILTGDLQFRDSLVCEALSRAKQIYSFDDITHQISEADRGRVFCPVVDENCLPPNRFGKLHRISRPVLGVFGTSSLQGKFTLQLKLRMSLLGRGYDVGQIGTEPGALLYGMDYVFPMGYNSSVHIREFDTVLYLNHIINELCMRGKEIIIVGSQSGTLPYDTGNLVNFNIPQFNFLMGTQPDAVILCVNSYDDFGYIKRTIGFLESGAGCRVISIVIFPMHIKNIFSGWAGNKTPLSQEKFERLCAAFLAEFGVPVFNLGSEEVGDDLAEIVINHFAGDGETGENIDEVAES